MSTELMPTEKFAARLWRLKAIFKWLYEFPAGEPHPLLIRCLQSEVEAAKTCTEDKGGSHIADSRYIVITNTRYKNSVDNCDWWSHDTLEKVQTEIEGHIFEPQREDYSVDARVFDSNLRKELKFKKIETIEWEV